MPAPQYMDKLDLSFDPKNISGYYVYIFSHKDVPFYVGLGKENRWRKHFHITDRHQKDNPYKDNKIKKIFREGSKVSVDIVAHRLSVKEAQNLEMKLIKKFGRKRDGGTLTNISIGGESGANGREHKEEFKKWLSISSRGQNSKVTEDMVYKAKLLFHYMSKSPKEIQEMEEYNHLSVSAISGWISKSNPNYSYVGPHLNCSEEMWEEKKQEILGLWNTGNWNYKQISDILGICRIFVSRVCRGLR